MPNLQKKSWTLSIGHPKYTLENYIAFKSSPFKEWIFFQTRIVLLDYLNRLFTTKYALKYCTFQFNSSRNLSWLSIFIVQFEVDKGLKDDIGCEIYPACILVQIFSFRLISKFRFRYFNSDEFLIMIREKLDIYNHSGTPNIQ